ncbi:MAG: hypothetical protein ACJZ78_01325 [Prochlorococcus marinus]
MNQEDKLTIYPPLFTEVIKAPRKKDPKKAKMIRVNNCKNPDLT